MKTKHVSRYDFSAEGSLYNNIVYSLSYLQPHTAFEVMRVPLAVQNRLSGHKIVPRL